MHHAAAATLQNQAQAAPLLLEEYINQRCSKKLEHDTLQG
jgi:hypothetical protein